MEHEITGHSMKAYKIWKNASMSVWKKTKEILIEMLIIVFAVSLAAFLEKKREHSNEQIQVKEFLTGLKTDLQNDIKEMEEDKKSFDSAQVSFRYIIKQKQGIPVNKDSIRRYYRFLFNSTELLPNDGRYQGFKSSGKISTIENTELQNNILDLYQESIPNLLASSVSYSKRKELLMMFFYENIKRKPDGSTNLPEILTYDKAQNVCLTLASAEEILTRYDQVIDLSKKIIAAIDKELK